MASINDLTFVVWQQKLKDSEEAISKWALQRGEVILDLDCLILVRSVIALLWLMIMTFPGRYGIKGRDCILNFANHHPSSYSNRGIRGQVHGFA